MNRDAKCVDIFWFQRLFGLMEPARAMWAAQVLLDNAEQAGPVVLRDRLALASSLLRQSLALNPYDRSMVSLLRQLAGMAPPPPRFSIWLDKVRAELGDGPGLSMEQAMAPVEDVGNDADRLLVLAGEGQPLEVRFLALSGLWRLGEAAAFVAAAERFAAGQGGGPGAPALAWGAWAAGEADLAERLRLAGPENFLALNLEAEMALARGDREGARQAWLASLEFEPGQTALAYRLAELERAEPDRAILGRHKVHVAFYTYNKLETTLGTLDSLLGTDIGQAAVTVLNNGSTAFAGDEFERRVRERAGDRPVNVVSLPVNIGAPAARNWLWVSEASQAADHVAFLDDDVLLPRDWLAWYLKDMEERPDTAVVGPKGVNPGCLRTIQYVYRYFQTVGEHRIRFMPHAPIPMDLGLYDLRRPCLSVMGCCHLLNRRLLERLGAPLFDVRFSPSQVDDLEHDIQIWLHGGKVLYDGRVQVVHLQDAGRAAPRTEASWAHVWGNHMKMEFKFSGDVLRRLDSTVRAEDQAHWESVLNGVEARLPAASLALFTGQASPRPSR